MNKIFFVIVIAVILWGVISYLLQNQFKKSDMQLPSIDASTIRMGDDSYVPMQIKIKKGETLMFLNTGSNDHWPASAIHPTHEIYPEFDSKRPIQPEKSWPFTFDKAGIWRYHDHLYPIINGSIVVE